MNVNKSEKSAQSINTSQKYLNKLIPYIRKHGLQTLKADDISRLMDISKATMYKYFSSKREIVKAIVKMFIDYIENSDNILQSQEKSFLDRFQNTIEQSILISTYVTDVFLHDIEAMYPEFYEEIKWTKQKRDANLRSFYQKGVKENIFQPIHPFFVIMQEERMVRTILEPSFLIEEDITLRQALYEYYLFKKYVWLCPHLHRELDDLAMEEKINYLVQKISVLSI